MGLAIIAGNIIAIGNRDKSIKMRIMYLVFLIPKIIGILFSLTIKSPFRETIFFKTSLVNVIAKI